MVMNFNSVGTNKKPGLILYGLEIVYRLLDHIVMCPSYPTLIPNFATPKDVFNINIYVLIIISMFMLYELATHLQQSHCKLCTSSCIDVWLQKSFEKQMIFPRSPPPPYKKKIPKSKNKAKKETNNGSFDWSVTRSLRFMDTESLVWPSRHRYPRPKVKWITQSFVRPYIE